MNPVPLFLSSKSKNHKNLLILGFTLILVGVLLLVPTGYEGAVQFRDAVKCRARVESVDNSSIIDTGLIRSGQQVCRVTFLSGRFKGESADGWNLLTGSLSQDKIFHPGDVAQCVVHFENDENSAEADKIISVNLIDYYRLHGELILAFAFAAFLVVFAGFTGLRSVLSFVVTVLVLWKILVPLYLKGFNPIFVGLVVVAVLTFAITALVYGFDRRLFSAFFGSMLGIFFAAVLSVVCTRAFHIHGAVMANSEALLYSGYQYLNLTQIFMASVCVGASGSVMDLSVDITSAVSEVVRNCPEISRRNAVKSGLAVARAAMGTMTTTLLLAYSGTCIALLMTFMAQGTPLYNILNNNLVASEIINTVAGSFGLASTAPFTALVAGFLIARK
ncbi:MAG: YibE/F family protein [Treponema sp.]|nr:YibE/F family protein [Treponema sp.]